MVRAGGQRADLPRQPAVVSASTTGTFSDPVVALVSLIVVHDGAGSRMTAATGMNQSCRELKPPLWPGENLGYIQSVPSEYNHVSRTDRGSACHGLPAVVSLSALHPLEKAIMSKSRISIRIGQATIAHVAAETSRRAPPSHAMRETVESIALAVILAFLFRAFVAEAFVIPTGSMAPTLMGQHKDVHCPECGYWYQAGASMRDRR